MPRQAHSRGFSSSRGPVKASEGFSFSREIENYQKSFNLYPIQLGRGGDTHWAGILMLIVFHFLFASFAYTLVSLLAFLIFPKVSQWLLVVPNPLGVLIFLMIFMLSGYIFHKNLGLTTMQSLYLLIFSTVHIPVIGLLNQLLQLLTLSSFSQVAVNFASIISIISFILVMSLGGYLVRTNYKRVSSGEMDERSFYIREIVLMLGGTFVNLGILFLFYNMGYEVAPISTRAK